MPRKKPLIMNRNQRNLLERMGETVEPVKPPKKRKKKAAKKKRK